MTPLLYTPAAELLMLADVIAGDWTGAKIHLYSNDMNFDPLLTVIADMTECTYTGYLPQTTVWGTPSVSDDGNVESVAAALIFRATDAVTPETAYGFWIETLAGGTLLAGGTFETPLPFLSAVDAATLVSVLRLNQTGYVNVTS